jgi:hypothetical protein
MLGNIRKAKIFFDIHFKIPEKEENDIEDVPF